MSAADPFPNAPFLTVADTKRSIRFYEKLGFALGNRMPEAGKPIYASLVLDRQVVMIGAVPDAERAESSGADKAELRRIKKDRRAFKKHRHGVGVELYLRVADPDAHHKSAARKGAEILRAPATHPYGIRDYVAVDPDGYRLVFYATASNSAEIAPAPRRTKGKKRKRAQRERSTAEALPAASAAPAPVEVEAEPVLG